jgi:hypothetical protein
VLTLFFWGGVWGLDRLKRHWANLKLSDAQKTLVPLIALNTMVFLAWRIPSPRCPYFPCLIELRAAAIL